MKEGTLFIDKIDTSIGNFGVIFHRDGIYRITLPTYPLTSLKGTEAQPLPWNNFATDLNTYISGKPVIFDVPLDWSGYSVFTREVYRVLCRTSFGEILTYRDVAEKIGKPNAARAVGQALAVNRHLLVIPCHRVVGHGGRLGGYNAGLAWKKLFLKLEGVKLNCAT